MKTKIKKTASKLTMAKKGKALRMHQTPPGETRQKALKQAYEDTYGQGYKDQMENPGNYGLSEKRMRSMSGRPQTDPTPFQNYLNTYKGSTPSDTTGMSDAIKNYRKLAGYKKGGTAPKGKPMMKKTSKKK